MTETMTNNVHDRAGNDGKSELKCTFTQTISFTKLRVSELLTSAIEGGSNYWYCIDKERSKRPEKIDFEAFKDDHILAGPEVYFHLHWPLSEGGNLCIFDRESEEEDREYWTLDMESIQRGLQVMADKYPRHFGDFLAGNDDADTGDVFLQCCLFGELVFG